jgi:hypothetical protein
VQRPQRLAINKKPINKKGGGRFGVAPPFNPERMDRD